MFSFKTVLRPTSFALALAMAGFGVPLAISPAAAQDAGVGEARQGRDGARHGHRGHRRGQGMRALLQQLDLSDAQRAEIRALFQQARATAPRGDRAAMRAHRQQTRAAVRAVLSDAQAAQLDQLIAQRGERRIERRLARMTETLGLSAGQQRQARTILTDARTRMQALRASGTAERADFRAVRRDTRDQLRGILDAEQQATFDARAAERRAERRGHRGPRGPRGGR
jgi:Spy/CpxP family protein refolding chaperone